VTGAKADDVLPNVIAAVEAAEEALKAGRAFLNRVESVEVKRSIPGRILGYGTIIVRGAGGTPEPFRRIARALPFQRQVQEGISQMNDQMRAAAKG
jgi:hypothetical protein